MRTVSEFIADKWGSVHFSPSRVAVITWLEEYANLVVDACVDNLEADPNPDEPGEWAIMRSSVAEVKNMIK